MALNLKMFDTLGALTVVTPPSMMNPEKLSFTIINLREKEILIIISKLIYCNNLKTDKELSSRIKKLIGITSSENAQNIDVINYNDWLSRKIENLT